MANNALFSSLKGKLKNGKLLEWIIIITLVVMAILIIYNAFFTQKKESSVASSTTSGYTTELEARLAKTLQEIEGVGSVQVMITTSTENTKVIAEETITNADGSITKKPILVGGNVVVIEELPPKIIGVVIVAEGGNTLSVRFALIEAAASALNIKQSIIKVYAK